MTAEPMAMNTQNAPAEVGIDVHRLARLSRYQKMPDDGYGDWIGSPNNGGDVGDMSDIVDELNGLLIALHDAINRPKGVVPESAERFYQANAQVDARREGAAP